jgi:hypothetical protein
MVKSKDTVDFQIEISWLNEAMSNCLAVHDCSLMDGG